MFLALISLYYINLYTSFLDVSAIDANNEIF